MYSFSSVKLRDSEEIYIYDRHSFKEAKIPKEDIDKLNLDKIRYGPVDYIDIAIIDQKNSYELKYVTIEKIICNSYDLGAIGIILTGGEPTTHPNFEDIIKLLDKLNFRWILVTNGNYNKELNNLILKYNPAGIIFNLDKIKKNWKKVKENIEELYKNANVLIKIRDRNKHLEKFVKEDIEKITFDPICYMFENRNNKYHTCGFFYNKLSINYDGSVYPCMFFREIEYYRLGNIYENSLKEIYYKLRSKNVVPKPTEYLIKKDCINCEHLNKCCGGCQGRALAINGHVGSKDKYMCEYYKGNNLSGTLKPNFDKLADLYKYNELPKGLKILYSMVIEILKELKVKTILDVGCGSGFFMDMAKNYFDVYGIDISKEMVETTNKKHPGKVFHCDILEYFPKIKYDATTCLYSFFCHFITIEKIDEVLNKIRTFSKYLVFDSLNVNKLPKESEYKTDRLREYVYRDNRFVYSFKIIDEKYYYSISYPIINWEEYLKKFGKIVRKKQINEYRDLFVLEFS